jgi:hypothetical protein
MSAVVYSRVLGSFFVVVALTHLVRLVSPFTLQVGSFAVPHWASWFGVAIAGTLGLAGLRARA